MTITLEESPGARISGVCWSSCYLKVVLRVYEWTSPTLRRVKWSLPDWVSLSWLRLCRRTESLSCVEWTCPTGSGQADGALQSPRSNYSRNSRTDPRTSSQSPPVHVVPLDSSHSETSSDITLDITLDITSQLDWVEV